jgi:ubiquinol-cytochrome c reductase iron-sulfur subunit
MAENIHPSQAADAHAASVDFLKILALAFAAVGFGAIAWAFIAALGPNATSSAAATRIINLATIAPGQTRIIAFRGQPILIRHLRAREITRRAIQLNPANPAFVVFGGVAPQHFCLIKPTPTGFTDPCDGTSFDPLGRALPNPTAAAQRALHLTIPPHRFLSKHALQLG